MHSKITKPATDEYLAYYGAYISKVEKDDLVSALEWGKTNLIAFMNAVPADKLGYRYQAGKWSIGEIFLHLLDVERIFVYRALRFSRNDSTALAGFDDAEFIAESNAGDRTLQSLLDEYSAVRQSTIEFFRNMTEEMSLRRGVANGKEISVRALGYAIPGHELHHIAVIRERYLG